MKKGFGLITALMVIVLVAGIIGVVVRIAFISVKHTTDTYMRERAELFMQSVLENSILSIEGYERNISSKCLKTLHFVDDEKRFEANVSVLRYYCYDINDCPCDSDLVKIIQTDKSHGNVLLKVVVETNNTNIKNSGKKIRIEKITLQRM